MCEYAKRPMEGDLEASDGTNRGQMFYGHGRWYWIRPRTGALDPFPRHVRLDDALEMIAKMCGVESVKLISRTRGAH